MSTIQLDFQLPAALRPGVRRRRQRPAPAGHDPPGPVRLGRAVLRHPARALRRRLPDLARARAGPRSCRSATTTTTTPARSPTACEAAGLRVDVGRRRRAARRPDPPGQARRSSPTCWWSATTTSRPGPSGSTAGAATGPERGVAVDDFVAERRSRTSAARPAGPGQREPLEQLWAGWRHDYVDRGHRARAGGRRRRRRRRLRLLPHRGQRAAVGRQRRRLARRAHVRRAQRLPVRQRAPARPARSATSASWTS